MGEKCTIQTIRLAKLEEDTNSAALASLVADGWEPIGSVVIDDGSQPTLHMILKPPRREKNDWLIVALLLVAITELGFIVFKLF